MLLLLTMMSPRANVAEIEEKKATKVKGQSVKGVLKPSCRRRQGEMLLFETGQARRKAIQPRSFAELVRCASWSAHSAGHLLSSFALVSSSSSMQLKQQQAKAVCNTI
jgi:hypothetical protein